MPSRQKELLKTDAAYAHRGNDVRIALAQETLARFGRMRFRATGGSMLPAIAPGDVLTFRNACYGDIRPGRVLLVRRAGCLVAHRMVECRDGVVLARGDALAANDAPVEMTDVLGVLVAQERGARTLHAGGRHWLRRQRIARWAIRRIDLARGLFHRMPLLVALSA